MYYNIHIAGAVYLTNWKNMHYFDDLFDIILAVNVVVALCMQGWSSTLRFQALRGNYIALRATAKKYTFRFRLISKCGSGSNWL